MKEETLKRVIAVIAVFGFSCLHTPLLFCKYNCLSCEMSLVARKENRLLYLQVTLYIMIRRHFFSRCEDTGFKWQSGFTPVTLLGKVSGKFETFRNKVLICLFIFPWKTCIFGGVHEKAGPNVYWFGTLVRDW